MRILYILVLLALALSLYLYDGRANFEIYRKEKGGIWFYVRNRRTRKVFWTQSSGIENKKDSFTILTKEEY